LKPLLIFGWGNPSRGDDALAPLLCERLAAWLPTQPFGDAYVVEQDFQLQVEDALELVGKEAVLFIDAAIDLSAPFTLTRIEARADASHSTHALNPQAVLATFRSIMNEDPPPAYLLALGGERFELGEPLSERAEANFAAAWDFLSDLCAAPAGAAVRLRSYGTSSAEA
jgi:hydrogenase maturation protease